MGGRLRDADDVRRSSLYKLDEGWTKELHICGQSDVGLIPNVHIISPVHGYLIKYKDGKCYCGASHLWASEEQKENVIEGRPTSLHKGLG